MAENRNALKRDISWYGSFCMGYADVGADIFIALGLVAFYAAGAAPLAFLIASLTYICTGLAYAELASIYPYAGGAQVYAMKAFNDVTGFIAGWAVMLDYIVCTALFSLAATGYLSFFFPILKTVSIPIYILGIGFNLPLMGLIACSLVLILLFLNIVGIKESSTFNEILVTIGLLVQSIILIFGFILAFNLSKFLTQIFIFGTDFSFPHISYVLSNVSISSQNFVYGVTLAMTSFIGIESIAQAAEETKRPYRWIPRASKLSIISVMVFALGLSTISMGIMPWEDLATAQANPVTKLAMAIPIIGGYIAPIIAIAGFSICYVSANTGIIGASRVVFSMGRFKLLPRWFFNIHPKFRTPHRTIIVFSLLGAAMALVGELHFIADLYNFGALLSYIIVNICLIVLRNKEPEAYRPWKLKGDMILGFRGRKIIIPIISLIGALSCFVLWLLVIMYHSGGRLLGVIWLFIGLCIYLIFRRKYSLAIIKSGISKEIKPSGYNMNALVLLRSPEKEDEVVSSIIDAIDTRFSLTLLNIIDPRDLGLSIDDDHAFEQINKIRNQTFEELDRISRMLNSKGFECNMLVRIGSISKRIEEEMENNEYDSIVLIKRKTVKGNIEKDRIESIRKTLAKYPGKLMVVRRISRS